MSLFQGKDAIILDSTYRTTVTLRDGLVRDVAYKICLSKSLLDHQASKAAKNKGRRSFNGPVVVEIFGIYALEGK